ncbi:MAG TPA: hypothetical protein VF290_04450 [Pyrinomonadaceae bacterium]
MITDCFGGGVSQYLYGLEEVEFLRDVAVLMTVVIPTAIGYALWRIFVTNRSGPVKTSILGLDESASFIEVYDHGISWRTLFLYGLTGFVFAFEAFRYVVGLL